MTKIGKVKAKLLRKTLPYGRSVLDGGGYVFFNRDYEPIERVFPMGAGNRDPSWWVAGACKEFFYFDGMTPWENRKTLEKRRRILADGFPREGVYSIDRLTEDRVLGSTPIRPSPSSRIAQPKLRSRFLPPGVSCAPT